MISLTKKHLHRMILVFLTILAGLWLSACTNPLVILAQEIQAKETSPVVAFLLDDGATINDNAKVSVGTASTTFARDLKITITNSGNSTLVIDFAEATIVNGSGTEADTFSFSAPLPTSIAAKSTGTLLIHFLPISTGAKTAEVTLPTNAFATPKISFTVEGSAVNNTNDILSFGFSGIYGIISGTSIDITLPHSYYGNVGTLKADFSTNAPGVTVDGIVQSSGVTTNNFANPVVYTLTAADGTTKTYTVTVTVSEYDLPSVSLASVSGVTSSGASATGSVDTTGGGILATRGICWSTTPNPTILGGIRQDSVASTGSFTLPIVGLAAGSKYYVRAWATTQAGTGYSENQSSFTTIPPAPTGLAASSTGTTNTITWTDAPGATSYKLYWANSAGVTTGSLNFLENVISPYPVTGRDWTKAYYYILIAENAAGVSDASGEVAAVALPTVPGGLSTITNNSSQITVSWLASSGAATYNLYWSTSPDVTTASATKSTGLGGLSKAVTGLAAGTTYYFIVTALNAGGETSQSSQVSASTIPASPTGSGTIAGNTWNTLNWSPVSGASSYNLYWSNTWGVTTANGTKISGISGTSYNHINFTNGTTYFYVLTAINSGGESVASVQTAAMPNSIKELALGGDHSLVLKHDGSLWATGKNDVGQLGTGTTSDVSSFVSVASSGVAALVSGSNFSTILKTDGTVWSTGYNISGQLGLGDTATRTSYTLVSSLSNVKTLHAGELNVFAVKTDGSLWATGYNSNYTLGLGDTTDRTSFTQVLTGGVAAVASRQNFALIQKTDGSLWGVGTNNNGVLGLGAATQSTTPTEVITSGVVAVACGTFHSAILKTDGSLWMTGDNSKGQLGLGNTTNRTTFTQVLSGGVAAITVSYDYTMILKTDGTLWAAGYNDHGQFGNATVVPQGGSSNTFVQVASGVASVASEKSSGYKVSMIVKTDGKLYAAGWNTKGALGLGTSPQYVTTFTDTGLVVANTPTP